MAKGSQSHFSLHIPAETLNSDLTCTWVQPLLAEKALVLKNCEVDQKRTDRTKSCQVNAFHATLLSSQDDTKCVFAMNVVIHEES